MHRDALLDHPDFRQSVSIMLYNRTKWLAASFFFSTVPFVPNRKLPFKAIDAAATTAQQDQAGSRAEVEQDQAPCHPIPVFHPRPYFSSSPFPPDRPCLSLFLPPFLSPALMRGPARARCRKGDSRPISSPPIGSTSARIPSSILACQGNLVNEKTRSALAPPLP